jgi:hypothetical protein
MNHLNNSLSPELAERLGFETLIAELSSRFVNLPSRRVDDEIEEGMRRVCEFLGIELSALWQLSQEGSDRLIQKHVYRLYDGPDLPDEPTWRSTTRGAAPIPAVSSSA